MEQNYNKYNCFNYLDLTPSLTIQEFINLIKLLPNKEYITFIRYYNIDVENKVINPARAKNFGKDFEYYLFMIEEDIKELYKLYLLYENDTTKILDRMKQISIRFQYPDKDLNGLQNFVKKMKLSDKKIIYDLNGEDLTKLAISIPEKSKRLLNIGKKIFLDDKNRTPYDDIPFLALSHEDKEYIRVNASQTDLQMLIMRHGENLNELLDYPKDNKNPEYYRCKYFVAVKRARLILVKRDNPEKYKPKSKAPKDKSIIEIFPRDFLLEVVDYLPHVSKNAVYLRHGKKLNEYLPWPKDKKNEHYNSNYYEAKKIITKIYNDWMLRKEGKIEKSNQIIDLISPEDLQYLLPVLSETERKVVYLRHGIHLDKVLPWPKNPEDKTNSYYSIMYNCTRQRLLILLEKKKNNLTIEIISTNITQVASKKVLLCIINKLPKNDQEIIYLRHGKELNNHFSWPENNKRYNKRYSDIRKKILLILETLKSANNKSVLEDISSYDIQNIINGLIPLEQEIIFKRHGKKLKGNNNLETEEEKIIYASARDSLLKLYELYLKSLKINTYVLKSIIFQIPYDLLKIAVSMLPENEQNIIFERHGKELDKIIPLDKDKQVSSFYHKYDKAKNHIYDIVHKIEEERFMNNVRLFLCVPSIREQAIYYFETLKIKYSSHTELGEVIIELLNQNGYIDKYDLPRNITEEIISYTNYKLNERTLKLIKKQKQSENI